MATYNSLFRQKKYIFDYYSNTNSEYCYIPILKNAHSWGKEIFKRSFNFELTTDIDNKKYIVILRDPYKRWLSGVGQWFFHHCSEEEYSINPIMLELIFDAVCLDGHTLPQIEYLSDIDLEKCTFFNLEDSNFEPLLENFIKEHFDNNFVIPEILESKNPSNKYKIKSNIQNQLQLAVENNPVFLQKIKHFYVEDYAFQAMCNFYNGK